jgi:hypothetical protein
MSGEAPAACCASCRHFRDDPGYLERSFPGWRSLGSAFGSARADDGICELHGRYLSARQWCARHLPGREGPAPAG